MGPVQAESAGAAGSGWVGRPGGASDGYLRDRQRGENFPVALRVLPREPRTHLMAVYDVARVIDDLGDAAPGDRTRLLTGFRADLATIWAGGRPQAPVLVRLAGSVAACGLSERPFQDLVEANLVDQAQTAYPTLADLETYCALSANPIGRMVLEVFGQSTPERVALSDTICTALQIIEHCQDVAEDFRAGRVYMPREDLDRFGVDPSALAVAPASPAVRALLRFETDRCRRMLRAGSPLIQRLRGWCRIAVAGYVAGGVAAIDGIQRAGYDVISSPTGTKKTDTIRHLIALLTGQEATR